jgi:large subunit ribosomal protein L29
MDIKDIRKLSEEDLLKKLTEIKEELFSLRFQAATGNLEKPHRVKQLRHTVARIKTVLRERELEKMNKGEQK